MTNNRFYVFSQAAEETKASFNPFLVEDSDPPLLLDIGDPDPNPIQNVLSYFQKDNTKPVWLILLFLLIFLDNNRHTTDNKIPSVFTATDGLPVVSHVIDGYKMAGEFKCGVVWVCFRLGDADKKTTSLSFELIFYVKIVYL